MKKLMSCILSVTMGGIIGASVIKYIKDKEIGQEKEIKNRFNRYYNLLNQWIAKRNEGKTLEKYFIDEGYENIAIYGMGEMGIRLYEELNNTSINIKYCIDKNSDEIFCEAEICSLEDELDKVDVIIVSPIYNFDEIETKISELVDYKIVSLEEVIDEM